MPIETYDGELAATGTPVLDERASVERQAGITGQVIYDHFGVELANDLAGTTRTRFVSPAFTRLDLSNAQLYLTTTALYLPTVHISTVSQSALPVIFGEISPGRSCHPIPGTLRLVTSGAPGSQLVTKTSLYQKMRDPGDPLGGDIGPIISKRYTKFPFEVRVDLDPKTTTDWRWCVYRQDSKGLKLGDNGIPVCRYGAPEGVSSSLEMCALSPGKSGLRTSPVGPYMWDVSYLVDAPENIEQSNFVVTMTDVPGLAPPGAAGQGQLVDFRVTVTGTHGEREILYFALDWYLGGDGTLEGDIYKPNWHIFPLFGREKPPESHP